MLEVFEQLGCDKIPATRRTKTVETDNLVLIVNEKIILQSAFLRTQVYTAKR